MTRRELNRYIRKRQSEGAPVQEIMYLEELLRLKFNYIPQILALVESKGDHKRFPHMMKQRKLNFIQRLILKIFFNV